MKYGLFTILVVSLSFSAPLFAQKPFVVHEWGTFTTLAGSDGVLLPGLYREEEYLPDFVLHFPGFAYGGYIHKGLYLECDNITLKMETPVIYFYSDKTRDVSVNVNWPGGTISQWFPERSAGEDPSFYETYGTMDFATKHNGSISWNAKVLTHSASDTTGIWKYGETHTWQAPRATDANVITDSLGNVEKYLFYRGVGNASFMDGGTSTNYLLKTYFQGNTLHIKNLTTYNILYGFVFERKVDEVTGDSVNVVWWSGSINDGVKIQCNAPSVQSAGTFDSILTVFRDRLVTKGLYRKEADAMIDTWRQSYFGTPGLRILWIVPHDATNKSLPLTITPQPDDVERVLVARSEILTPGFEKQLVADFAIDNLSNYENDRYFLAYQARVAALTASGVKPSQPVASDISISPNPFSASAKLTFSTSDRGATQVSISNLLGTEVARLFDGNLEAGEHSYTWEAKEMPPGMYLCIIRTTGSTRQMPLMLVR
jgi:hypothetical protein